MATQAERSRKHYLANREAIIARNTQRNKETRGAERKRYDERYRTRRMAKRYNVTMVEMERLLSLVECECCGAEMPLNTDHRHDNGKVRGRLCNNCNLGIGLLGDTPDGVRNALRYLEERHG